MWYELYFNKTVIKPCFLNIAQPLLRSSSSKVWNTFFLVNDWLTHLHPFPLTSPLHLYGVCKLVWAFILWSERKLGQMDYIKLSYFWQRFLLDDMQNNPDGIYPTKLNALANLFLILSHTSVCPPPPHPPVLFFSVGKKSTQYLNSIPRYNFFSFHKKKFWLDNRGFSKDNSWNSSIRIIWGNLLKNAYLKSNFQILGGHLIHFSS